jgi:hypothetical protein
MMNLSSAGTWREFFGDLKPDDLTMNDLLGDMEEDNLELCNSVFVC